MLAVEWSILRAPIRQIETEQTTSHSKSQSCKDLESVKSQVPIQIQKYGANVWRRLINSAHYTEKQEVASRAYFKLKEIMESCALSDKYIDTLHICEAPGGFVQQTCDRCKGSIQSWTATSLQSSDIRFDTRYLDMTKGTILTLKSNGDVLQPSVREQINLRVDFVTADGATNENHDTLERDHIPLLWAQTSIALKCLKPTGDFVCKFFEGNEFGTKVWIAVMTNCFRHVSIIKPNTSRATNSERYLVCRCRNDDIVDLEKNYITSEIWIQELQDLIDEHSNTQKKALTKIFDTLSMIH